jgi:AraC-like DNA-binding protein
MPLAAGISVGERVIDLAIIDCGAAVDVGLSLLQELKNSRPEVPVFFITEASSESVVMQAFKLGARDYFIKPFDPIELSNTIARILHFKGLQPASSPRDANETPQMFLLADGVPERLLRATGYIDDNLSTHLSLELIAQQACLSKYHFCRLFKRYVGISPLQYCLYRRIEHAQKLLAIPSQSITITAFRSGFNDVTEFIRQFKKIAGITPGLYRQSRLKALPQR